MEQRGRVLDDGDVGTIAVWFTYETGAGEVKYQGYARYAFPDGSTKLARLTGAGRAPGQQHGTMRFMEGTGRFEGIEGTLGFTAEMITPMTIEGRQAVQITGQYSLPK
jgi:hypothetical protein